MVRAEDHGAMSFDVAKDNQGQVLITRVMHVEANMLHVVSDVRTSERPGAVEAAHVVRACAVDEAGRLVTKPPHREVHGKRRS
jgi:hypothetical protein